MRRGVLDRLEPPFLDLHAARWVAPDRFEMCSDARRFENWETNFAGKIGLGVAIDYALDWGLDAIQARITSLAEELRQRLAALPHVTVRDRGTVRCGIVTFTVGDMGARAVQQQLAAQNINTSVSRRESTLLDMTERGLMDVLRASVHYYNTEEELDRFCNALAALT